MDVILWDVKRATYERVTNVEQLTADVMHINGRLSRVWILFRAWDDMVGRVKIHQDETVCYKQRDYEIYRIED